MPLAKQEKFVRYPPISMIQWESKTSRTFTFLDNDKDVNTPNGVMYLFPITEEGERKELWVKPNSAIAIGISSFVPLKDKTLKIMKTGKGIKGVRYNAEEVRGKS